MVLSHCLKTDFYDSLTVGLNPKPLVIFTVFSFLTKQHKLTQQPHLQISVSVLGVWGFLFFFFFFRKNWTREKKNQCFCFGNRSSVLQNVPVNPETLFDRHFKAKTCGLPPSSSRQKSCRRRENGNSYPAELEALVANEHNYLAFPPLLLFFFLLILLVLSMLF